MTAPAAQCRADPQRRTATMIAPRDELPPAPSSEPTPVESIRFIFDPPKRGWLEGRIILLGTTEELFISDVFDPFPPMLTWLRLIIRGEIACFSIDQEGDLFEMAAEPGDATGAVRLTAWADELKGEDFVQRLAFDVRIPRHAIVAALYDGIHAMWEKPDPYTFWKAWYCLDNKDAPPGELCVQYSMRDEEIVAFLGRAS